MIIVERNGRIVAIHRGVKEVKNDELIVNGVTVLSPASSFGIHEVPDQDLSALYVKDDAGDYEIVGRWPDAVPIHYTGAEITEREAQHIDLDTGKAIDEAIHPFAGQEEQLGILRDQIVRMLNGDMTASDGFKRLNEIAIQAVDEGAERKESL